MTYAVTYNGAPAAYYEPAAVEPIFVPRSRRQWIALIPPVFLCGASWAMGGVSTLTDAGFLLLTVTCIVFLIAEFRNFSRRFGIGGLLLYGGVLVWFCHDYMVNWFGLDFHRSVLPFSAAIVAKAAYFHTLFIMLMALGLSLGGGRWIQRIVLSVPEPGGEKFYLILLLLALAVGISPFFIWVAEPFYMALLHGAFSAWTAPVKFTVYRTGNLNYSWGGYVAQILQAGEVAGIFGAVFAILVATRLWGKIVGWSIWLYWVLFVFNDGRRGDMAFMVLPAIALLYIKYQASVAQLFRKHSWKAYGLAGTLAFLLLFAVQLQGSFRDVGLGNADLSQVSLLRSQGNGMFSESMLGYALIPQQHDFFSNFFPGAGVIVPLPQQAWFFVIGPIPRALWQTKPVDDLWSWYNHVKTGDANGAVGTTIAKGLVGTWYFHYGIFGVIEGGILVGWLMGLSERCLQNSGGRPISMLMSLGLAVWLFRVYRDFIFIELYAFMCGAVVLAIFSRLIRPFSGTWQSSSQNVVPNQTAQPSCGV